MEGTNPTFKNWLLANYRGVDSPFGDLADDVACARDFPAENSREAIFGYLRSHHACRQCVAAFNLAWGAYTRRLRRMSSDA